MTFLAATGWPEAAIAIAAVLGLAVVISVALWQIFATGRGAIANEGAKEYKHLAEELTILANRAYDRLRDASNLRAWLYKIATNTARTHRSRNHRRPAEPLPDPFPSGEKAVEVQVLERTQLVAIKQAVMELPDRQRAALMMRKYQELEYSEIAEALDCSEATARANVYQALKKLRQQFAEVEE